MKYSSFIAAALLAVCVAPVLNASPELDEAVRLATPSSKAGLDAICLATYKAVKKNPGDADKILEAVLGQRANWKSSEVYAILRSVLLARPDLMDEINLLVTTHRTHDKNGKNGNGGNVGAGSGVVGAVSGSRTLSPMLASLVTTLFDAGLNPGVAEEALNMTVAVVAGTFAFAYESAFEHIGVDTMTEFIPTPSEVSPH